MVQDWTRLNPDPDRTAPKLVQHSVGGFILRPGQLRPGIEEEDDTERKMTKNLTWSDFFVGWPNQETVFLKYGWLDVFQFSFGQRPFYADRVSIEEVR